MWVLSAPKKNLIKPPGQLNKVAPLVGAVAQGAQQASQVAQAPVKAVGDVLRHAGQVAQQQNTGPAPSATQNIVGGAGRIGLGTAQMANNAYQKYKQQQNSIKQQAQPAQQPQTKSPPPTAQEAAKEPPSVSQIQPKQPQQQLGTFQAPSGPVQAPLMTSMAQQQKIKEGPAFGEISEKEKMENANTASNIVQKPLFGKT